MTEADKQERLKALRSRLEVERWEKHGGPRSLDGEDPEALREELEHSPDSIMFAPDHLMSPGDMQYSSVTLLDVPPEIAKATYGDVQFDPVKWTDESGNTCQLTLMNKNTDKGNGALATQVVCGDEPTRMNHSWFKLATSQITGSRPNDVRRKITKRYSTKKGEPDLSDVTDDELEELWWLDLIARQSASYISINDKLSRAVLPKHIRDHVSQATINFTQTWKPKVGIITKDGHRFQDEWVKDIYQILFVDTPAELALRFIDWWLSDDREATNERAEVCEKAWEWVHKQDNKKAPDLRSGLLETLVSEMTGRLSLIRQGITGTISSVGGMSSWDAIAIQSLQEIAARLNNEDITNHLTRFSDKAKLRWGDWSGTQLPLTVAGKEIKGVTWVDLLSNFLTFHGDCTVPLGKTIARFICEEMRESKSAGVIIPVQASMHSIFFSSEKRRKLSASTVKPGQVDIINSKGQIAGRIGIRSNFGNQISTELLKEIEKKLKKANTVTSHELLRYLTTTTYDQLAVGMRQPDAITVIGGVKGLVESCGLDPAVKRNITEIKNLLDLYENISIHTIDGDSEGEYRGLIWVNHIQRNAPGKQSVFRIQINEALLANYEQREIRKGHERRKLIPVPLAPPPLHGRKNEWANQYGLQNLVFGELRKEARELAETGTVEIDNLRWAELGDEAELTKKRTEQVREAWLVGTADRPPMLHNPSAQKYTLNRDVHRKELNMILEAGKQSAEWSKRAKRRTNKK